MTSPEELATLYFYQWEARGRGHIIYTDSIDLVPPYAPYKFKADYSTFIDDGKVPSLLKQFTQMLKGKTPSEDPQPHFEDIKLSPINFDHKRIAFKITFSRKENIPASRFQQLLELLCHSIRAYSFEILAQYGTIIIQFTAYHEDSSRLEAQLRAFFPTSILIKSDPFDIDFDINKPVAIADFGLDDEFMIPIQTIDHVTSDPLTSIFGTLDLVSESETAIIQIIFQGTTTPWTRDILSATSDGEGGSFFNDLPDLPRYAREKTLTPLFGAIVRVGTQGKNTERSEYLAQELAQSITSISNSAKNRLIPLSNEGYSYDDHLRNIFYRTTNRLGCILNSKELALLIHYPTNDVISPKLNCGDVKSKRQQSSQNNGITIGVNAHENLPEPVRLNTETRLSHTHIIGATGVGKSTLMATMMLEDINSGRGCTLIDPHGDICDDVLARIPEHRRRDVIIIDPSDSEFPVGLNILQAHSEAEKVVLISDLVSIFKQHSTAWGDNMTAVLHSAIATFLHSSQGGTLIELKRFLLEDSFRSTFLKTVTDPSLIYYWNKEYPMMRKGITPLLTRIDTFLRSPLIRSMVIQKTGVDITQAIEKQKIVLIKLSQGLIGESNSYLLGSLILAKISQAAHARQQIPKEQRKPYFLYCDEFQNFITPSIGAMLSGARKYGLGLILAHQELAQIDDQKVLNSVISNPTIRICFRLGDQDAKRLESGFSYFDHSDLQNLKRGEAIMRIDSQSNDFNLTTSPLEPIENDLSNEIINSTRASYGTHISEIDQVLNEMYSNSTKSSFQNFSSDVQASLEKPEGSGPITKGIVQDKLQNVDLDLQKRIILEKEEQLKIESEHRAIQNFVLNLGQERNYKSTLEAPASNGGRIDVLLSNDNHTIAVEVSVTNTAQYEIQNLKKCLQDQVSFVCIISDRVEHLKHIAKKTKSFLSTEDQKKVFLGTPSQFLEFLDKLEKPPQKQIKKVRGYRVKTSNISTNNADTESRSEQIQRLILNSLKPRKN